MKFNCRLLAAAALAAALPATAQPPQPLKAEVIHWWTSGGESAAVKTLAEAYKAQGGVWVDTAVALGEQARSVAINRIAGGNPPTAAQFNTTQQFRDIVEQGYLNNVDAVAQRDGWDKFLPETVLQAIKVKGHFYAAPVNIHNMSWFWFSKAAFKKAGIAEEPKSFDELFAALDKLKAAGLIPLAHGGQPWQEATIFDGIVLSEGTDFYKQAFIDLDPAALGGEKMADAFNRLLKLRTYVDDNFSGRDWNLASAMVINGQGGMQIMGDWAKGEFLKAGKKPGVDFVCIRFPGTQGSVTFNSDQFAMFNVQGDDKQKAQAQMASSIESPKFQSAFNVVKGSVPARTDVPDTDFDDCGKKGIKDLAEANTKGTLFGSMAHGHAAPAAVKNAVYDVVTGAFNGKYKDGAEAAQALASAVAAAK